MDNSIFLQMDCFYDCFYLFLVFGRTSASVVTVLIFGLFVCFVSSKIVSKGAWKGGNDPATYQ